MITIVHDQYGNIIQTMQGVVQSWANYSVLHVEGEFKPYDATHRVENGVLVEIDNSILAAKKNIEQGILVRKTRATLLAESDWVELPSASKRLSEDAMKAWEDYRQALRDLPSQEGFPHTIQFPEPPK